MVPTIPLSLAAIRAAQVRLQGIALRTPLVRLGVDDGTREIYLKLENLQPIGSFKLRGAGNALAARAEQDPEAFAHGVYTASAGNMAQGVAWCARRLGIPCHVVVPDHAPRTKLAAIRRLGAEVVEVPFDDWWRVIQEHHFPGMPGTFVHPVSDPAVIAGNGTIGLEILEDCPEPGAILVPFGGGGLSCGIASAVKALRPEVPVFACEAATAAPLAAALAADAPVGIDYVASFVDGIGGKCVLAEMWPLARQLLAGSLVVDLPDIANAVRLLAERNRVIVEGAGATPVAAALTGSLPESIEGPVVCVVSGGNIDVSKLTAILAGDVP